MRNALIAALVGVLVSAGVVTASERGSGESTTTTGASTTTTDTTTTTGTTTTRGERAADRRESARKRSRNRSRNRGREGRGAERRDDGRPAATAVRSGEDVSGPCDEAEHANDPRCTGASVGSRSGGEDRHEAEEHGGRGHEAEDESHAEDGDDHGRNRGRGGDDHDEDDD